MSETAETYVPRMKARYWEVAHPRLKEMFGYRNDLQVPRLEKVALNMGVGAAARDSRKIKAAAESLALIAGQKPIITKARRSEANFKLRRGMNIGVKVTLRRDRMFEFVDRLVTIALPRVRDFRGLNPDSFDGNGNFALGIKEHIVFPEIDYDKIEDVWGLDVVVCTTARGKDGDRVARELLRALDFPFPAIQPTRKG